jgi:hypothetical protein
MKGEEGEKRAKKERRKLYYFHLLKTFYVL